MRCLWLWLFGLCDHKWEVLREMMIYHGWDKASEKEDLPRGVRYTLQCTKCGNIKVKKDY